MKPSTYILTMFLYCIAGGYSIACAHEWMLRKKYFCFGLFVMFALSNVISMVFATLKLYGGI